MLGNAGSAILNVGEFVAAVVPVLILVAFAWWFLRAGRRYDERERAAGREPPPQ